VGRVEIPVVPVGETIRVNIENRFFATVRLNVVAADVSHGAIVDGTAGALTIGSHR